jgi:hypothetical protein
MGPILTGTIAYFVIFVVSAWFINDYVTKDVNDANVKKEYTQ